MILTAAVCRGGLEVARGEAALVAAPASVLCICASSDILEFPPSVASWNLTHKLQDACTTSFPLRYPSLIESSILRPLGFSAQYDKPIVTACCVSMVLPKGNVLHDSYRQP